MIEMAGPKPVLSIKRKRIDAIISEAILGGELSPILPGSVIFPEPVSFGPHPDIPRAVRGEGYRNPALLLNVPAEGRDEGGRGGLAKRREEQ